MGCWQSSVLDSDSETGLPHTQQITDDNFVGHLRPHAYTNQCRYGKFAMIARRTAGTSPQVQSAAHRTQLSVCWKGYVSMGRQRADDKGVNSRRRAGSMGKLRRGRMTREGHARANKGQLKAGILGTPTPYPYFAFGAFSCGRP